MKRDCFSMFCAMLIFCASVCTLGTRVSAQQPCTSTLDCAQKALDSANRSQALLSAMGDRVTIDTSDGNSKGDGANYKRADQCPAHSTLIGGGCDCGDNLNLRASGPLERPNQWICKCERAAPSSFQVAYAICLRDGP